MRLINRKGFNTPDSDLFDGFKERHYGGHKKLPTSVDWNKNGSLLASGENNIRIWSLNETSGLQKAHEIKGHDSTIECIKFMNVNMLASMSRDQLKFWDIRENALKPIRSEKKLKSDFVTFAWNHNEASPTYTYLNKDNILTQVDFRNTNNIKSTKPPMEVGQFLYDMTDCFLICAGGDNTSGTILLYDKNLEILPETYQLHTARIDTLAVDPFNKFLATTGEDSLLGIHSLPDIICQCTYCSSDYNYKRVSFSREGHYLAAGSEDSLIDIFNVQKGGQAYQLKCLTSQEILAWHPTKMILCFVDEDQKKKSSGTDKTEQCFLRLFVP